MTSTTALFLLPQLSSLCLDNLGCGEGLPALTQLTSLSLAPQQGARVVLRGMPRLRRLAVDLSCGSCGRDLLSEERGAVHVPADHGLAALRHLELRCFVWRHWEAAGSSAAGSSDGSDASSESTSVASSSAEGSNAGGSEAGSEGSGSASEGGAGSEADSDASWDDMDADLEDAAGAGPPAGAEGAPHQEEHAGEEEEEEQQQGQGLLEASWGFMRHGGASAGAPQQAHAMLSLEQR